MNIIKTWWKDICQVPLSVSIVLTIMAVFGATMMIRDNWLYRFILYIALWLSMMSIIAKDIKERKIKKN